jgi:hypothetical protein
MSNCQEMPRAMLGRQTRNQAGERVAGGYLTSGTENVRIWVNPMSCLTFRLPL